ncbi:MAG TPA: PilZ domain-containing protein [Chromatiaceae bacterium]|jgi:hypothetical protein|nr:PilZ domain-containing protein [Chromatiaceae bacterium]HIN83226.1 PilZ domain-containing protein [Chromatiales bacterium]HIA08582.1 PilZ domain-containing protein [Chromatiaceae bacterium]HIB83382.1 PilZ domain-containing protein [Chromatiaceae bacterium]HIO14442.1 PilZ domain-containing protein [Chromatiales bacterium]
MREYIRHPSDIPIQLSVDDESVEDHPHLNDISLGGLSFSSHTKLEPQALVQICIPLVDPPFIARGRVAWCRRSGHHYDVGIELLAKDEVFRARLVEQICHIEHYKHTVKRREGRDLTSEEAAHEWIGRFAADFPAWNAQTG